MINYNLLWHRPINNRLLRDILDALTNHYQFSILDKDNIFQKYNAFGRDPILGTQPYFEFDDDHIIHPDLNTVDYQLLTTNDKTYLNQVIEDEVHKHQIVQTGDTQIIFYQPKTN